MEQRLGRNSIVGTTIRNSDLLPKHLSADEKHSGPKGDRICVPTTVGDQCVSGVSVSENAGEDGLRKACGKFREEAPDLNPRYQTKSVNTDGRKATVSARKSLFPEILIIACFLHLFIKIRDRSGRKLRELPNTAADKTWYCCGALSEASFPQRVRGLCEWADTETAPDVISGPIMKLKKNLQDCPKAYDVPGCHRTGNMADRLMRRTDRRLSPAFCFHGSPEAAELSIRGRALTHNFAPCNPITAERHNGRRCPAEWLSKSGYHDNF